MLCRLFNRNERFFENGWNYCFDKMLLNVGVFLVLYSKNKKEILIHNFSTNKDATKVNLRICKFKDFMVSNHLDILK